MIERVDRTLWTNDELRYVQPLPQPPLSYSMMPPPPPPGNAFGPSLLDASPADGDPSGGGGLSQQQHYLNLNGAGAGPGARERMYERSRDDDSFRRGGSTRTSKYRARMEKARKDFLQPVEPQHGNLIGLRPFLKTIIVKVQIR